MLTVICCRMSLNMIWRAKVHWIGQCVFEVGAGGVTVTDNDDVCNTIIRISINKEAV
jgi:hypothetical protein